MASLGFHWSVAVSYLLHYSVFVLFVNNCCWSTAMFTNTNPISPDTSDWCRSSGEHGSAYDAALKYFGVDSIRSVQLNDIIQNVFHKFGCEDGNQSSENKMVAPACVRCLNSENIYKILRLKDSDDALNETSFQQASVIILTHLLQHPSTCQSSDSGSHRVEFSSFPRQILQLSEVVNPTQESALDQTHLDILLRKLAANYVPIRLEKDRNIAEGPQVVKNICLFTNSKEFDSSDIERLTQPSNPEVGISQDELGKMSSILIMKLVSGECIAQTNNGMSSQTDFVRSIFLTFSKRDECDISKAGIEQMALALKIRPSTSSNVLIRPQRDTAYDQQNNDYRKSINCLSIDQLLENFEITYDQNLALTKSQFIQLCPALLQQSIIGCRNLQGLQEVQEADNSSSPDNGQPSNAEKYGYGTLSVAVISICPIFSIVLVRWRKTAAYKYIITTMLGLCVGSLVGDALLHLIPQVLGLDDHSADGHADDEGTPMYVWKMLVICGSIWLYFVLQLILQGVGDAKRKTTMVRPTGGADNQALEIVEVTTTDPDVISIQDGDHQSNGKAPVMAAEKLPDQKSEPSDDNLSLVVHVHSSVAWMVTIGDALHNFTDGLAIGAAFSTSWQLGLSTSVAVFTHELPHEFGDAALLLSTGWSAKRVILFQVMSQVTAFIGLYIGISISSSTEGAQQWIFAVGTGMFFYVALSNVVPELLELFSTYSSIWVAVMANVGIFIGFTAMLLLAVFEEDIQIGA